MPPGMLEAFGLERTTAGLTGSGCAPKMPPAMLLAFLLARGDERGASGVDSAQSKLSAAPLTLAEPAGTVGSYLAAGACETGFST